MYFLGVKSTAHPPIIGALGHSTHFIVKQPNMASEKRKAYLSLVYFCKMYSTCVSSKLCEFILFKTQAKICHAITGHNFAWPSAKGGGKVAWPLAKVEAQFLWFLGPKT